MARPVQPNGAALRNLIRKNAATKAGYLTSDSKHLEAHLQSAKTCERMIAAGQLFRASYPGSRMRYFDSAEAVAFFQSQSKPPKVTTPRKSRAKPAHLLQVKPVKPPTAIKPPKVAKVRAVRAKQKTYEIVARKPYSPPVPRRDAEIVHTAHTRYSSTMMPTPRNTTVTHSFIHGGMGAMR